MQQQLKMQEQLRATLLKMQKDMNEYFAQQERSLRQVYGELRGRLEKIQQAVMVCNGSAVGLSNTSGYMDSIDHATPVFTRYISESQRGAAAAAVVAAAAAAAGNSMMVPSTPPSERMPFMHSDSQVQRGSDMLPQGVAGGVGEDADWAALTGSSRLDVTPAVSPQKQWRDDDHHMRDERNPSVDYTCFETLDRLMNDDDIQHSAMTSMLSPYIQDDEIKQQQQQQSMMSLSSKPDVIHISTLSSLQNQHLTTSLKVSYVDGRPKAVPVVDGALDEPEKLGIDIHARCKVLVEFKRKRVLQFESKEYVPPGSYVIVGGDRGEDLGLVTYTWCETTVAKPTKGDTGESSSNGNKPTVLGVGLSGSTLIRSIGLGTGTVLRLATESEVAQLHTVQVELERRAIDVCSQRVLERGLPMTIVDAEYQFDKNKLTFFYEAQQRMDFRELVRDLYKTFRARIWMETVES
ncbi:putative cell cycle sequence binding phosphoprotein (RBP45) [Trypanosoma theileri]|uniref:Putative cell cycle sequence binding phosphoprotein (RBP45) n=1 Tax=Trypanosoma theileri TaxID=67003 RepID=A0A1X0P0F2_9TRYP|nr:putative cell cycle sequence binding phosphoprotein (RBP45) [Trypanosoma theileri]ORC90392.1 putative cell cycle sequence binding phosphoprotein (RBP45) [Trypanosoma theileri]